MTMDVGRLRYADMELSWRRVDCDVSLTLVAQVPGLTLDAGRDLLLGIVGQVMDATGLVPERNFTVVARAPQYADDGVGMSVTCTVVGDSMTVPDWVIRRLVVMADEATSRRYRERYL